MTCNPWRWLWGLIPVAILSWVAVHFEHERIEADLTSRSAAALGKSGLDWASPVFAGRDAIITGQAASDADPARAIAVARDTWGVRVIENRAELLQFVEKFTWSAALRDNRVKLTGYAPGEDARRALLAAAKSTLKSIAVDDEMRVARGSIDAKSWIDGASFSLSQIAGLRKGSAEIDGSSLSISGEANDEDSYKSIKTALSGGMPSGLKLARESITLPVAVPYVWSAKVDGERIVLSGYAPDEAGREAVLARASKSFAAGVLNQSVELAGGAPDGWQKAALAAIEQLGVARNGVAELNGRDLTVTAELPDEIAANGIRKALKAGIPGSIRLIDKIGFKSPPAPPVIDPYKIEIIVSQGGISVTGHVPSEDARTALLGAVKARFGGRTVRSDLQIGAGAPDGWQQCIIAGLSGLSKLDDGTASLEGRRLKLTGSSADKKIVIAVPADIKTAAGRSCDANASITFTGSEAPPAPQPPPPPAVAPPPPPAVAPPPPAPKPDPAAEQRKAEAQKCQKLLRDAQATGVINFEYAKADLLPDSLPTLGTLARIANDCPTFSIEIGGHTDSDGTPERHQKLSDRRAKSVVDYLVKAGVDVSRLVAVGYGATQPIADNATPEGRAKNRRIEFTVKEN